MALSGMSDFFTSQRAPRRYRIEAKPKPSGRPSTWDLAEVTVFDGDTPVGCYERDYIGWAASTFEPFERDGHWFALYAPEHTGTRIMSLPDCRDIGGEAPDEMGFCPVEFWVPRFKPMKWTGIESGNEGETLLFETETQAHNEGIVEEGQGRWRTRSEFGAWTCHELAFVAGCIWGDDSSWKVQVIDLSHVADGAITRSERFGYLQLPHGMSLSQAIHLHRSSPEAALRATILEERQWDVGAGTLIDPFE